MRCAVVVNDMASMNIDSKLIANGKNMDQNDMLVELQNGCICCTLRDDLLDEVRKLAGEGRFDYLLIESTCIS